MVCKCLYKYAWKLTMHRACAKNKCGNALLERRATVGLAAKRGAVVGMENDDGDWPVIIEILPLVDQLSGRGAMHIPPPPTHTHTLPSLTSILPSLPSFISLLHFLPSFLSFTSLHFTSLLSFLPSFLPPLPSLPFFLHFLHFLHFLPPPLGVPV